MFPNLFGEDPPPQMVHIFAPNQLQQLGLRWALG